MKKNTIPNYLTIIWFLMCLRIMLFNFEYSHFLEYFIFAVSTTYFVFNIKNSKKQINIIVLPLIFLFLIQIVDILQNPSIYALKNVLASFCVFSFIFSFASFKGEIQKNYIKPIYFILSLVLILLANKNNEALNTVPACYTFMSFFMIYILTFQSKDKKSFALLRKIVGLVELLAYFALPIFVSIKFSSRTAMVMPILLIVIYIAFHLIKRTKFPFAFKIVTLLTFLLVIFYINIDKYDWLDEINFLSNIYFDKNINSGRPYLWRESLLSLNFAEIILGRGTGVLPNLELYSGGNSFHSTYIQLLMQNGLISLVLFLIILNYFWKTICKDYDKRRLMLCLSIFSCVIVYNAFECTLLQNKTFLGEIQWLIIALSMNESLKFQIPLRNSNVFIRPYGERLITQTN